MPTSFHNKSFILADDLVRGTANIYASYRGRVLFNKTFDVCRDLHVKGLKCPMRKGIVSLIIDIRFIQVYTSQKLHYTLLKY
jgi:hypothetical protein